MFAYWYFSDTQFPENDEQLSPGHLGVVTNGSKHVLRALSYFKQQDVDLIIMIVSCYNVWITIYNVLLENQLFCLPYKEHIHYRGCHKNGKYSLRIRAINCWGEKSKWLKTSFLVEPAIVQCREQ